MAVSGTDLLWGCPQMNFKANPPFNEMRQGFATFKKETRMAQYLPELFENFRKEQVIPMTSTAFDWSKIWISN